MKRATPSRTKATRTSRSKRLPAALRRNDERAAEARLARIRAQVQEDVDLVVQMQDQIAGAFYEIGCALQRLDDPAQIAARNCRSFEQLCAEQLKLSLTTARELMAIATRVRRSDATHWRREKSEAVIEVAHALEPDDVGVIDPKKLQAAVRGEIDIERADGKSLHEFARQKRHARQGAHPGRGRTITPEERGLAARVQAALRAGDVQGVTVEARATRPGRPAVVAIEQMPIGELAALARALERVLGRGERRRGHADR